jgi:glycosidase
MIRPLRVVVTSLLAAASVLALFRSRPVRAATAPGPPVKIASLDTGGAPIVTRVDPPSWWANARWNPVRLLVYGRHLSGAGVRPTAGSGVVAHVVSTAPNGAYCFVDARIAPTARPGDHSLRLSTSAGTTMVPFTILPPLTRTDRTGFGPDDVVYLLMPDRFADGDPRNDLLPDGHGPANVSDPRAYHGGDLQGVIDRLPYLKDLGVTAIWMTPIYQNSRTHNNSFHGYGAIDFYGVEDHYGTLATLRELIRHAHAIGIKVIQDQVANHCGDENPWVSDPPTPKWFNGALDRHPAERFDIWTAADPHATAVETDNLLRGWFASSLPDLNQDDTDLARYEIQNSLWWIGTTGFDGIREDTMPYVPRSFWQKWSSAIHQQYPNFHMVGELYSGDVTLAAYFQGGRTLDGVDTGMDSLTDYPLAFPMRRVFGTGAPITQLAEMEAHDWMYPHPEALLTFFDNHDLSRLMHEQGATLAGLDLANTFLLTTRGTPCLYYGDEIGMDGGNDPDNRRDFPGGIAADGGNDAFTASGRTAAQTEVFNHVRALLHLRASLPALRRGEQKTLSLSSQQWVYARMLPGAATVIVALNNATNPATVTVPVAAAGLHDGDRLMDRLRPEVAPLVVVDGGRVTVALTGRSGAVLTVVSGG